MIELKMYENKLNRAKLAEKLGIGKPKLSQILNGKRDPDVAFLKAVYQILHLDPKFILEHI
jgi:HTH-type transcriptional regulator / antitoxin HigA